jgi:hypothetical protein
VALDGTSFAERIENLSDIHNSRQDPHSIWDYLSDTRISTRMAQAMA